MTDYRIEAASREEWAERALRAETEVARLREALEPGDGRPCVTDQFLAAAMEELDDKYDFFDAVKDWIEGDFVGALDWLPEDARAALKGEPK